MVLCPNLTDAQRLGRPWVHHQLGLLPSLLESTTFNLDKVVEERWTVDCYTENPSQLEILTAGKVQDGQSVTSQEWWCWVQAHDWSTWAVTRTQPFIISWLPWSLGLSHTGLSILSCKLPRIDRWVPRMHSSGDWRRGSCHTWTSSPKTHRY